MDCSANDCIIGYPKCDQGHNFVVAQKTEETMQIDRRSVLGMVIGASVAPWVATRGASAQSTIRLTISSSHPTVLPWVGPLQTVAKRSNELLKERGSKHQIEWTQAYGGQLYGAGDTLEAVTQQITDCGWIGSLFEPAKLPLQNIMFSTPFSTTDARQAAKTMNALNKNEQGMKDEWAKQDVIFFGACCADGYSLFTKEPLDNLSDIKGRKILGVAATAPLLKPIGAAPVTSNLTETYSHLQTGVGEGVIMVGTGAFPLKVHEVAPYVTKVDTGPFTFGGFGMNRKVFDKLPEDVQQVLVEMGEVYSTENASLIEARSAGVWNKFKEAGAKVREMSHDEKMMWVNALPDLGKLWVETNEAKGVPARKIMKQYMATVRSFGAKPLRDWAENI